MWKGEEESFHPKGKLQGEAHIRKGGEARSTGHQEEVGGKEAVQQVRGECKHSGKGKKG